MNKDPKNMSLFKWFFVLGTVLFLTIFIVVNNKSLRPENLSNYLMPKNAGTTELYFLDHDQLPLSLIPGRSTSFRFAIHNLETHANTYEYQVTAETATESAIIGNGTVDLDSGESKNIDQELQSFQTIEATDAAKMKVTVRLINKNQTIHFWLNKGK